MRPHGKQVSECQRSFFDDANTPWSDAETWKRAAESISLERLTRTQELVLAGLQIVGPSTDDELIAAFRRRWPSCRLSDQSIRSRRAQLVRKGLVRDSGRRRLTKRGQRSAVWEVA
jgi:hypothetical protein